MMPSSLVLSYLFKQQYLLNYSIQSTISGPGSSQYPSKVSSSVSIISLDIYLPYNSEGASIESRTFRSTCRSQIAANIAVSYFSESIKSPTRISRVTGETFFAGRSTNPIIMFEVIRFDMSAMASTLFRKVRVSVFAHACRSSLFSVSSLIPFSNCIFRFVVCSSTVSSSLGRMLRSNWWLNSSAMEHLMLDVNRLSSSVSSQNSLLSFCSRLFAR